MTFISLDPAIRPRLLRFASGYWFVYLVLNCVLWSLAGVDLIDSLPGKLVLIASCVIMALVISLVLKRAEARSVSYLASLGLGLSLAAAILFVVVDHINLMVFLHPAPLTVDAVYIGLSLIEGVAIFFGWFCLSMMLLCDIRPKHDVETPAPVHTVDELTVRQREILALLLQDKSNKEIARSLNISPLTVRNHISVLFRQFGVKRRKDLASLLTDAQGSPTA